MAINERTVMRLQWKMHKLMWNLSGGRLGRKVNGMPVVEVVAIGHKSGQPRQILIFSIDDGGVPAIVGTNAGKDVDPAWAKNLRSNPQARARWDGVWQDISAVELEGDDHERVWQLAVDTFPGYGEYRTRLTRPVPIFRLEPAR